MTPYMGNIYAFGVGAVFAGLYILDHEEGYLELWEMAVTSLLWFIFIPWYLFDYSRGKV